MPFINTLGNSLRTVAEPIPHFRSAALGIWVDVGSSVESPEDEGLCHVLEHMVFKGTKKRTAAEIAACMDALGGYMNAYTSKEQTCFYAKVIDEHFAQAYDVLTDIVCNPILDAQDLEKEKLVILEEIAMTQDNPEDLVHDLLAQAYFGKHSLAHSIAGESKQIEAVTAEKLKDFYKRNYTPDKMLVSAAGAVDLDRFAALNKETFASMQAGENKHEPDYYEKDPSVQCIVKNKDVEQTHLCLGYRGVRLRDSRSYAMLMLNNILGGGMSSRLFRRIREEKGLVYSVYSFPAAFREGGMFGIYAATSAKNVEETLQIIREEILSVCENGVNEEEFLRAREQIKISYLLSQDSVSGKMNAMGNSLLFHGKVQSEQEILEKIARVDPLAIQNVAKDIFLSPGYAAAAVGEFKGKQENRMEKLLSAQ